MNLNKFNLKILCTCYIPFHCHPVFLSISNSASKCYVLVISLSTAFFQFYQFQFQPEIFWYLIYAFSLRFHFFPQVAVGQDHVIAVTVERVVYTWGDGSQGQLGHGNLEDRQKPEMVEVLKGKSITK